jgi:CRISPR system Cascade subunit CasC
MFIELHLLQNFAPSNLNRDDNNMPKDTPFGGVRRARVSSQSWKYAIRKSEVFKETVGGKLGVRTTALITLIKERMSNRKSEADTLDSIVTAFVKAYAGDFAKKRKDEDEDENPDKRTAVLLYLDESKIDRMAELLNEPKTWDMLAEAHAKSKKPKKTSGEEGGSSDSASDDDKSALSKPIQNLIKQLAQEGTNEQGRSVVDSADIALFGMMLAAKKNNQQVEAACQVAHAISTHRVEMEMDYFTAMDDKLPFGAQGAGMLGQTDFNSSCYYRYARLDWDLLVENLRGNAQLARRAVKGFLLAFAQVVPSGKQKPFAALNEPDFALAVVRQRGMGWSLANAFEKAVHHGEDGGYVEPSITALDRYYGWLKRAYDHPEKSTVASTFVLANSQDSLKQLKESDFTPNIYTWAESVTKALTGIDEEV